jgi:beta-N-acetylhexosaminidase
MKHADHPTRLSLQDKAAQLIMIDLPGTGLSEADREHLARHAWNGVILFAKNVASRAQVTDLIEAIHAASPQPALIAVDQEGGLVDRFRFPEMSLSPGAMALGATQDPQATYRAHVLMGRELRDLGVHVDFAPCLDVNVNPANPIIGVRSFGEDPQSVAAHGSAALRGLRDGGVAPTAKHFPGHGDTSLDSHLALPTLTHGRERLEQVELLPFRAAVAEKVEAIMTAHVTFPALDPTAGLPATLSAPVLTGLLRQDMGYQGVIVTDSLAMRALADRWGFAEATVRSIEAGADLVLALGPFAQQLEALKGLVEAVRQGRLSETRLDESLRRLADLRQRFQARPSAQPTWDVASHQAEMREIASRGVTVLLNREHLLPLNLDPSEELLVLAPDLLPLSPLGEVSIRAPLAPLLSRFHPRVTEQAFHLSVAGPPVREVARRASEAAAVVLALYARDRLPDAQRELAQAVLEANPRTVLVSLSSPYILGDLPTAGACVLGYNYGDFTLEAISEVLMGRRGASGRLPVTVPGLFPAGHGLDLAVSPPG